MTSQSLFSNPLQPIVLVCLINFLLFGPATLRTLPPQTAASQEKQTDKSPAEPKVAIERGNPQRTGVYASEGDPAGQIAWDSRKLFVMERGVHQFGTTQRYGDSTTTITIFGADVFVPYPEFGYSDPIVADGRLYFSLHIGDGYLYALDVRDGDLKWWAKREKGKYSPPVVAGDTLFVGADSGLFFAIDLKTNQEKWRHTRPDGSSVMQSPNVADGNVYYSATNGVLYALDADDGQVKWAMETRSGHLYAPVVSEGVVYLSVPAGIAAFEGKSGKEIWRLPVKQGVRGLAVANGLIYFSDFRGHILTAVAKTGQLLGPLNENWQTRSRMVIKDQMIFFIGWNSTTLFAVDSAAKTKKWEYPNISELECSAPVADRSRLYLTCSDGRLYAVDAMTGKKVWTSSRKNKELSAPVIANGMLYFIGDDGKVHAVK